MSASTDLLVLVISLVWACLQVPGSQNRLFAQLFFAIDVVNDLASAASLTFCPGLFEVLDAAAPPTVEWFKQLPDKHVKRWGVYVLVFERSGMIPWLYCGEGTDSDRGVSARWALYDKHNLYLRDNTEGLPSGVIKAFKAGMKITHKGLIVSAPIPSAAYRPMYRLLFYAMEAAFSFRFWMMDPKRKSVLYRKLCPWSLDAFEYEGLCSHSALHDPIAGRFDLSSEELTILDNDRKERERAYQAAYRAARLAEDPEGFKAKQKQHIETFKQNHPGEVAAISARSERKIYESGIFRCDICGVRCKSGSELNRHNRSSKHKINVRKAKLGVSKPYKCLVCPRFFDVKGSYTRHCEGQLHLKKVRKACQASSSSST